MFGAILKATNSSFKKGMPFCHSIYVKKVMKLLAFIFEQPSYQIAYNMGISFDSVHTAALTDILWRGKLISVLLTRLSNTLFTEIPHQVTSCISLVLTPFIRASALDFQQCSILTCVDSDELLQHPFKLRNSEWCSVSSLTIIEYSNDQQRL